MPTDGLRDCSSTGFQAHPIARPAPRRGRPNLARLSAVGVALAAGAAWAQQAAPANAPRPVFLIEADALSTWFPHKADAGVVRAGAMLAERLNELPGEIPDAPGELSEVLELIRPMLGGRMEFAVAYQTGVMPVGYGVVLNAYVPSPKAADATHDRIMSLLDRAGEPPFQIQPSADDPRVMEAFVLPTETLAFGPATTGRGSAYRLQFGKALSGEAMGFGSIDGPGPMGMDPVMRVRLDVGALTPLAQFAGSFAGQAGPEAGRAIQTAMAQALALGILGDQTMTIESMMGHTESATLTVTTIERAGKLRDGLGLETKPLGDADLAAVPSDAIAAFMGRYNTKAIDYLLNQARTLGAPVDELLASFQNATGVDPVSGILRTLGGTGTVYFSDTTGGGGLGSLIAMAQIADVATFAESHAALREVANGLAEQIPTPGRYVKIEPTTINGIELNVIRFAGLPVPFEITYTVAGDRLILGGSPQAALAAARQVLGKGDQGLATNPAFTAYVPRGKQLVSLNFIDSNRTVNAGYDTVSLVGAALSNAARSAVGNDRNPGLVAPSFSELKAAARPIVSYAYWEGDSIVMVKESSRSMLATMAVEQGLMASSGLSGFFGLLGGVLQGAQQSGDLDGFDFDMGWLTPAGGQEHADATWTVLAPGIGAALVTGGSPMDALRAVALQDLMAGQR